MQVIKTIRFEPVNILVNTELETVNIFLQTGI
jgi:hypothetical protein